MKPTYCACCSRFIYGLIKQAQRCHDCGLTVHHQCVDRVPATCTIPKAAQSMASIPVSRIRSGVLSDSLVSAVHNPPTPSAPPAAQEVIR